jgi:acetyl-CoA C-acetyltransferase
MREVVIAGIGQTPVGELWDVSLRSLAYRAIRDARADAGGLEPQALYIGNFLASVISHQANLGALLVDNAGLGGIEAYTLEAAGASGGAAFQSGYMAVASGLVDVAAVVGVEKATDAVGSSEESALTLAMDMDYEAIAGLTTAGQAGLLLQRYLYEYGAPRSVLGAFAQIAYANALHNPNAMNHRAMRPEQYEKAPLSSAPLNIYDESQYADGAAALILTTRERAAGLPYAAIKVAGLGGAIDTLALHDRPNLLGFDAVSEAVSRALDMAGAGLEDLDFFEPDDAYSIYALLCLEAAGFAEPGNGWRLAQNGDLTAGNRLPILTLGGAKGRGNPIGAAGVYQLAEAALQLRGQAGGAQVPDARLGLTVCLGGPASTAFAHVLERCD